MPSARTGQPHVCVRVRVWGALTVVMALTSSSRSATVANRPLSERPLMSMSPLPSAVLMTRLLLSWKSFTFGVRAPRVLAEHRPQHVRSACNNNECAPGHRANAPPRAKMVCLALRRAQFSSVLCFHRRLLSARGSTCEQQRSMWALLFTLPAAAWPAWRRRNRATRGIAERLANMAAACVAVEL